MKLMSLKVKTLTDVFVQELRDIYHAENQLVGSLPKMAAAASDNELRYGFESHLDQTREHVERLERIFETLALDPSGEKCEAMEGLISEGNDYIGSKGSAEARDAGLIAIAQKVEHYEIAAYGTLCSMAHGLGNLEAADLLRQTLNEETETDRKLTAIAERVFIDGV